MKFLLVEDDESFAEVIKQLLAKHHYLVDVANNGRIGQEMAEAFPYDLIVLDWILPQESGLQVCQALRAAGDRTPILLMTIRDAITDKVAGLDAGADDYLVKPFSFEELLARIRALLRRVEGQTSPVLHWGDLCLDPRSAVVSVGNQPISLTPKEYRLLELFLRHPQFVFSADALLDRVWSAEDAPCSSVIRTHIKGLRQKLKQVGLSDVIKTLYGIGYRLAPQDETQQNQSQPSAQEQALSVSAPAQTPPSKLDLTQFWQMVQDTYQQRVNHLALLLQGLLPGDLNEAVRQQLAREAHALAGSLGSFGFPEVTAPLLAIEQMLQDNAAFDAEQAKQLGTWISQVQQQLSKR